MFRILLITFTFFGLFQYSFASDSESDIDGDLETDLRRASRSCVIYFKNDSNATLTRSHFFLESGEWRETPPRRIGPKRSVLWSSESCGVMTGTEGLVKYTTDDGAIIRIIWNNPYLGKNKIKGSAGRNYKIVRSGKAGDNAVVRFRLQ